MPKQISKSHQEFIRLVISGVTQKEAYRVSIGKKGVSNAVCESKGSKLCKQYAQQIGEARQKAADAVTDAYSTKAVKEALKSILNQSEVDAKLCSIINGTFEYEDVVPVNGKLMKLKRQPNANETAKAIDLYNKRFGSNAAQKLEVNDTTLQINRTVISKKV